MRFRDAVTLQCNNDRNKKETYDDDDDEDNNAGNKEKDEEADRMTERIYCFKPQQQGDGGWFGIWENLRKTDWLLQ